MRNLARHLGDLVHRDDLRIGVIEPGLNLVDEPVHQVPGVGVAA